MRKILTKHWRGVAAAVALVAAAGAAVPVLAAATEEHDADYYLARAFPTWLAGAWVKMDGDRWTEEYWTGSTDRSNDGTLVGVGRSGRGDRIASMENMRVAKDDAGLPVLFAKPRGAKKAVEFPMTSAGPGEIVFLNPDHDYPQRIHYLRKGLTLTAEISLEDGSRAQSWEYRLLGK